MQPSTNQDTQTIDSTAITADNQIDTKQQQLAHLAQDTRFRMKRSTEDLIQIGLNMTEAKKLCEHGEWLPWLEKEFTDEYALTNRTAQHYMNVAQKFGDKCETVSYLPIAATALYMLAANSVPDEAREEAITRAVAGETISKKKANQIIKQYTSVSEEIDAKGKSLGLPTRGDSILPASDRLDDLTHSSPADVDDRPGAPPAQIQPISHNYNAGDRITPEDAFAPTPAQWRAAQVKHAELLQALKNAQFEIEHLLAERDSLNTECLALQTKNGDLHNEIAYLQGELRELKAPLQLQADAQSRL